MASCLIVGGSGFIGTHLARHFLNTKRFSQIDILDIRPSALSAQPGVRQHTGDVRKPFAIDMMQRPEWIFNLAAVHREPGHQLHEYFDTNIAGARNVCNYAEAVGCNNIFFTSSISVYGPTNGPVSEAAAIRPNSPYGASKYPAELVHEGWQRAGTDRRLIICRPGVVYGPGDPGNVLRMIRAIKRGYFALPGHAQIRKSYGYIY